MSPTATTRRVVAGLVLAGICVGATGCGSATSDSSEWFRATLARDAAVEQASVGREKVGLYGHKLVAAVTLKHSADISAFQERVTALMHEHPGVADSQVNVTRGSEGFSIVSDDKLSALTRDLATHLRATTQATHAQAFLGDVEVTVADGSRAIATYEQLARDKQATNVAADGRLQVNSETASLGKRGRQALDASFLPAIGVLQRAGVPRYAAFMDYEHGPVISADYADVATLPAFREQVRAAGYTGPLQIRSGKTTIYDDLFNKSGALVDALNAQDSVRSVEMRPPALGDQTYRPRVSIVVDSGNGIAEAADHVRDLGQVKVGIGPDAYEITDGASTASGGKDSVAGAATMVRDLLRQQGVVKVAARDRETSVTCDADGVADLKPIMSTIRAHRWWNSQRITVALVRGDAVVEQARFESTSDGPANLDNTGRKGQSDKVLEAWNATQS